MIDIIIDRFAEDTKKYANYRGMKFTVSDSVDNFGDRTVMIDKGQPFMFIADKDCKKVNK